MEIIKMRRLHYKKKQKIKINILPNVKTLNSTN